MSTFLTICSEWTSAHGGLATFNRSLAVQLARRGHRVGCLVLETTPDERHDAEVNGVELYDAFGAPDGPTLWVETSQIRGLKPDVIVGHDRVTGSIAFTYAAERFPDSALVHIIHTAPSEIEWFKNAADATKTAEARDDITRRIAAGAAVVAAVGPRLAREAEQLLSDGYGSKHVVRMDPGIDIPDGALTQRRVCPPKLECLVAGRVEDFELKGLDLAARALGLLPMRHQTAVLVARGAAQGTGDALHQQLVEIAKVSRERVIVREFTSESERVRADLLRATALLLPSRVEGFGLIGLEAIELGTPVLVSSKSGLAELLVERLGSDAARLVVDVNDDGDDGARWADALAEIFADAEAAFDRAHAVRGTLAEGLTWDAALDRLLEPLGM